MSKDKHTIRRLRREQLSAEFDANRGREGQIQPRINAKGEVELVAFFGGKWYYCPMAEFNKKLNMRHGAQVDGRDIMTNTQFDSSGFKNIRLDAVSSEMPPKLNECKIFVDTVAAKAAATETILVTNGSQQLQTVNPGTSGTIAANIYPGLNVSGTGIPTGAFITVVNDAGDGTDPLLCQMNVKATAGSSSTGLTFQTMNVSHPNAFLNVQFKDATATFYHKFQLNNSTLTPFYDASAQVAGAGYGSGGGGTGGGSPG